MANILKISYLEVQIVERLDKYMAYGQDNFTNNHLVGTGNIFYSTYLSAMDSKIVAGTCNAVFISFSSCYN